MEIKAQLEKPYTEKQRIDFIVQQNHKNSYEIRETEAALEAWGYTEEEKAQKERERLNLLSMTKREMFLGLYQAKQITPDMLKAQITDPKALIEFEYANGYYRGNPLIDIIGGQLGFTSEQLDKFFETKDYKYLTTCKLTINPTPAEATVVINSEIVNEVTVPYGSIVDYVVSCDGYESKADVFEITKDEFLEVVLDEDTTDTTTDIQNELDTKASGTDKTDTDILE